MSILRLPTRQKPQPRTPAGWRYSGHSDYMLKLLPHLALEEFLGGTGALGHWNTLAFRLHVALELARRHATNVVEDLTMAVTELDTVYLRGGLGHGWVMSAQEATVVGTALWYADCLQDACTRVMQKAAGVAVIRANALRLYRVGITSREQAARWLK